MQIRYFLVGSVALMACTGDDVSVVTAPDAGPRDATTFDAQATVDAGAADAPDATLPPALHLLMTQQAKHGELVSIDPIKGAVDGRLAFSGFGFAAGGQSEPFLVQSSADLVARLDRDKPWIVRSSWSVAGGDGVDGGSGYADPVQVVVVSPNKAYVLRFNRNSIAIIDPTQSADGGVASSYLSLASLQQPGDHDGSVDMSGAIFDPARKRLYVALSNIDLNNVDPNGYFQICGNTKSSIIAIDTTTDKVIDLGGQAPGGGVALAGVSPQFGAYGGLAYDAVGDRLLVLTTGCNQVAGDGGAGPLVGRGIEAVTMKDGKTQALLNLNSYDFPGQMLYVGQHEALVQVGYGPYATTYRWDPATSALGAPLASAPDVFAFDAKRGTIVGPQTPLLADGGVGPVRVVSVSIAADGGVPAVVVTSPFSETGGFFGNAVLFPGSN
jgi:hypothetical protein